MVCCAGTEKKRGKDNNGKEEQEDDVEPEVRKRVDVEGRKGALLKWGGEKEPCGDIVVFALRNKYCRDDLEDVPGSERLLEYSLECQKCGQTCDLFTFTRHSFSWECECSGSGQIDMNSFIETELDILCGHLDPAKWIESVLPRPRNKNEREAASLVFDVVTSCSALERTHLAHCFRSINWQYVPMEIGVVLVMRDEVDKVIALANQNEESGWSPLPDILYERSDLWMCLLPPWESAVNRRLQSSSCLSDIMDLRGEVTRCGCLLAPVPLEHGGWGLVLWLKGSWWVHGDVDQARSLLENLLFLRGQVRPFRYPFRETCSSHVVLSVLHHVMKQQQVLQSPDQWRIEPIDCKADVPLDRMVRKIKMWMYARDPSLALVPEFVDQREDKCIPFMNEKWREKAAAEVCWIVDSLPEHVRGILDSYCLVKPMGMYTHKVGSDTKLQFSARNHVAVIVPLIAMGVCPSEGGCEWVHTMEDTVVVIEIGPDSMTWMVGIRKEGEYPQICGRRFPLDKLKPFPSLRVVRSSISLSYRNSVVEAAVVVKHSCNGLTIGEENVLAIDLVPFAVSSDKEYAIVTAQVTGMPKIVLHQSCFSDKDVFMSCLWAVLGNAVTWEGASSSKRLGALRKHFFSADEERQVVSRVGGFHNDVVVFSGKYQIVGTEQGRYEFKSQDETDIFVFDMPKKARENRSTNKQAEVEHPSHWLDRNWMPPFPFWFEDEAIHAFRQMFAYVQEKWKGRNFSQFFFCLAHQGFAYFPLGAIPCQKIMGESKSGKTVAVMAMLSCSYPFVGRVGKTGLEYFLLDDKSTPLDKVEQICKWGRVVCLDDYDFEKRTKLYQTIQTWTRQGEFSLTEICNPEREGHALDQEERTMLHSVNWQPLEQESPVNIKAFEDELSNMLHGMHRIAPVLRKCFNLSLPHAFVSDDEWKPFEDCLRNDGVVDGPSGKMYKVVSPENYRLWLQFGLCQAELLGDQLGRTQPERRATVFDMFRTVLGMKPLPKPEVVLEEEQEGVIRDFVSVKEVNACWRKGNVGADTRLWVVEAFDGKWFWVWSDLLSFGEKLKGKEGGQLRGLLNRKRACPFTRTVAIPTTSVGIMKLVEAGARKVIGSADALLVSVDDPALRHHLWIKEVGAQQ